MPSPSRPSRRRTGLVLGFALALPLVGGGTAVAQDEPSLCDTIGLDALNGLGEPSYAEPAFGSADFCFLEAATEQQGPHSVSIWVNELPFGLTFDEMRDAQLEQTPTYEDTTVAGNPALVDRESADGTNVTFGLGERFATIFVSTAGSVEGSGLDEGEYALAVAELVAASLPAEPAGDATGAALEPPAVEGITWRTMRTLAGVELDSDLEAENVLRELWDLLLTETGASFEAATMIEAVPIDAASEERLGSSYLMLSIAGADATTLTPVLEEWLAGQQEGFSFSTANVGGKDVTEVSLEGEPQGYIYAEGDTLHVLSLTGDATARVLEALP